MKKILAIFAIVAMTISLMSCTVNPSYDTEVAFMQKPIFFGETKVQDEPCTSFTFHAWTTTPVKFYMLPVKHSFKFDDMLSDDNTPLDINTTLTLKVQKGKTPVLLRNYGERWYETFIESMFKRKVKEYVSQYSPFDLMSDQKTTKDFDGRIANDMRKYIDSLSTKNEFPVDIVMVVTESITPNEKQKAEMNNTAATVQKKRTQEVRNKTEQAREKAEISRAKADKAYIKEMGLTPSEYIQLKWIETIAAKQGANIDVMVGPATSMWDVKQK